MRGYELSVAAQQEWPGPGPREGDSDMETHLLVQELIPGGRGAAEVRRGRVLVRATCRATQRRRFMVMNGLMVFLTQQGCQRRIR
jgi:hypothetical protein